MLKSLLLKNFYILKKSSNIKTNAIFILIVSLVLYFLLGNVAAPTAITIILLSQGLNLFSIEEKHNTLKYLKTLPIKESTIILEKITFNIILVFIAILLNLVLFLIDFLMGNVIGIDQVMGMIISIIVIYSIYSIYIPLVYKYSVQKAPIIVLMIWGVIALIVLLFVKVITKLNVNISIDNIINSDILIFTLILSVALIINLCSYFSAVKILKNKDL